MAAAISESCIFFAAEIAALPFERYAPVRKQLWELLRLVNRARRAAHLPTLLESCVRARRKPCVHQSLRRESVQFSAHSFLNFGHHRGLEGLYIR